MSRLTKRVRCDVSPMILKLLNLEETPEECIEVVGTDSKTCDEVCEENQCKSCVLSAVFEKLAHYEDLEEQGRLIIHEYGSWERIPYSLVGGYRCGCCGQKSVENHWKYCPNCGAKMDEVE